MTKSSGDPIATRFDIFVKATGSDFQDAAATLTLADALFHQLGRIATSLEDLASSHDAACNHGTQALGELSVLPEAVGRVADAINNTTFGNQG